MRSLLLLLVVLAGCTDRERSLCPPIPEGHSVNAVSDGASVGRGRFVEERDGWIKLVDASSEEARWAHWIRCNEVTSFTVTE